MLQSPGGFSLKMLFLFGGLDPSVLENRTQEDEALSDLPQDGQFLCGQIDTSQNLPYT